MMQRMRFPVNTAAPVTDTGPAFTGSIYQMKWEAGGAGDTGDDLAVYLQQTMADTGDGVLIAVRAASLANDFFAMPRRVLSDTGLGNGNPIYYEPVISAGEHLRVRVAPGGALVRGTLYVWAKDN